MFVGVFMTIERLVRGLAGSLVVLGLVLSYSTRNVWWLGLILFAAFDLIQSCLTNKSIIGGILKLVGLGRKR